MTQQRAEIGDLEDGTYKVLIYSDDIILATFPYVHEADALKHVRTLVEREPINEIRYSTSETFGKKPRWHKLKRIIK